jgi:IclR helix-turn-helix domain
VTNWSFLTSHARVLPCIARDPGARLRDLAASPGITARSAHGIVTGLAEAGYVIRQKDGRRNRYRIQAHLPVPEPGTREPAIGEVVALFAAQGRPASPQAAGTHPQSRNGQSATQTPAGAPAPADGSPKKGGPPMSTAKKLNPSPC